MKLSRHLLAVAGATLAVASCDSNRGTTAPAPDTLYWQLLLDNHAITLAAGTAPYDTVTLAATPLTVTGTTLQWDGAPVWTVTDTSLLSVSSGGVVTAKAVGQAGVVASLTIGNLTLADTAMIYANAITPPPPVFGSMTLQGQFGPFSGTLVPTTLDVNNNVIPNTAVYYWSSDSSAAAVDQYGNVTYGIPGPVTFYSQATVYGITMRDSLSWNVPYPLIMTEGILSRTPVNSLTAQSYFSPQTDTIPVTGIIVWMNTSGQNVDMVFDDSTQVDSVPSTWTGLLQFFYGIDDPGDPNVGGNIPSFATEDSTTGADGVGIRMRYFPQMGTFNYHSTLYGTTGSVVVIDTAPSVVTAGHGALRRLGKPRATVRRMTLPQALWRR